MGSSRIFAMLHLPSQRTTMPRPYQRNCQSQKAPASLHRGRGTGAGNRRFKGQTGYHTDAARSGPQVATRDDVYHCRWSGFAQCY